MNYRTRLAALERARTAAPPHRPDDVPEDVWSFVAAEIARRLAGRPRRAAALSQAIADMNRWRPARILEAPDPIIRAYMRAIAPGDGGSGASSADALLGRGFGSNGAMARM